ncbi:Protein with tetrapyrrole methyltransferase and pyrophosphatase domains [Alteromonas macleodii]|uniref:Protein with tetrapyrrole methyltransferase and pyrophosphatase domains n=2 Tax=Alteromonas macleodii TaxID=28108 RepID=A0A6T9Y906_ALTMA|nr:SAM-dependent methyltransferase [Alteromonas macleodii]CAB9494910.1 Protein with tetrapyrrole methyltransferase and pyrophosphatase domains [Alteromonas macleodii]
MNIAKTLILFYSGKNNSVVDGIGSMDTNKKGSLVVVGTGISVAGQMTLAARSHIENADIVFMGIMNKVGEYVVTTLNPNSVSLDDLYEEGKSRALTYSQMADRIVESVIEGNKVCVAFYGHPGVFVTPSHEAVRRVQDMNLEAKMLPGVSAEDCLIADLGIDPSRFGCQSYEATQFLFRDYRIDPHMTQIIWQIGLAGEATLSVLDASHSQSGLAMLADILAEHYPEDHELIIYEAATLPLCEPKIERVLLRELEFATPTLISTLVVPSKGMPAYRQDRLAKLGLTEKQVTNYRNPTVN